MPSALQERTFNTTKTMVTHQVEAVDNCPDSNQCYCACPDKCMNMENQSLHCGNHNSGCHVNCGGGNGKPRK